MYVHRPVRLIPLPVHVAGLDLNDLDAIQNTETTYEVRFVEPSQREVFIEQLIEGNAAALMFESLEHASMPRPMFSSDIEGASLSHAWRERF